MLPEMEEEEISRVIDAVKRLVAMCYPEA